MSLYYSCADQDLNPFQAGKTNRVIACDPNHQEESVMSGKMVLGVNPYREICALHLAGQMLIDKVIGKRAF